MPEIWTLFGREFSPAVQASEPKQKPVKQLPLEFRQPPFMQMAAAIWREIMESPFPYDLFGRPLKQAVAHYGLNTAIESFRRYCEHIRVKPDYLNIWAWLRTVPRWLESRDPLVIRPGESLDAYQTRLAAL